MSVDDRGRLAVAIDGHRFQADLSGYQRGLIPWQRQPTDDGAEAGLSTLNTYGAWRRFQSDFGLGSGQETFDRPDDSRRRVFIADGVTLSERGAEVRDVWVPSGGLYQALSLDGEPGSHLSTPDSAPLSITGDLDVRWFGVADDWTPIDDRVLVSKFGDVGQRSWSFFAGPGGSLELDVSAGGSAVTNVSVASTGPDGLPIGLRVTWRASDGRVQFFIADDPEDPGTTWTQEGSDQTANVGSLFDGTASLVVGGDDSPSPPAPLNETTVSHFEVRDGIDGTIVASGPHPAGAGQQSFFDPQGNEWTVEGGAEVVDDFGDRPRVQMASTLGTDGNHWTYAGSDQLLMRTDDQAFEPYWEPVDWPQTEFLSHLSAGGGYAYATDGDGQIYRSEASGSVAAEFTAWSTLSDYEAAWYVNGRLLAYVPATQQLQELDDAGDESGDPVDLNMTVNEVIESPFGIYAVGYDDRGGLRRGVVKRIPVADDGSLGVAELATELPVGERVFTAVSLSNYLVLGTSKGGRLAQFSGGGTLSWFPAVDVTQSPFGEVEGLGDSHVFSLVPHGDVVWFAALDDGGPYGPVGWFRLSEFTAPGEPSFQTHDLEDVGFVGDVAAHFDPEFRFDRPTLLSAINGTVRRLVDDQGNSLESVTGEFLTGWISYGVPDEKVPTSITLQHSRIPVDGSIEVYLELDDGSHNDTLVGVADTLASTETTIELTEGPSERLRLRFVLTNGSDFNEEGAVVRLKRWTMFAVPVPNRTRQFVVPIMAYEEVSGDGRQPGRVAQIPRDIIETLEDLAEARTPVVYEEGNTTYRVVVDGVDLPEDESRTWDSGNNFPQGMIVVTLLTVD